jgi:hypothetical protein
VPPRGSRGYAQAFNSRKQARVVQRESHLPVTHHRVDRAMRTLRVPRSAFPGLTTLGTRRRLAAMSLLLPQTREAIVRSVRWVDIHGDRYLDLALTLTGQGGSALSGRVGARECPADLAVGEQVSVRITLGVITRVERVSGPAPA